MNERSKKNLAEELTRFLIELSGTKNKESLGKQANYLEPLTKP